MIDRYVIDTHPTSMYDPSTADIPVEQLPQDEEEVEEPVVVAAAAPSPRQMEPEVEEEPEVLISSSWSAPNEAVTGDDEVLEQEFNAALQGEEIDDGNTFSPERLSRSLEQQQNTGNFSAQIYQNHWINFFSIIKQDDTKVRMSTSKTPPPSPFEPVDVSTAGMKILPQIKFENPIFPNMLFSVFCSTQRVRTAGGSRSSSRGHGSVGDITLGRPRYHAYFYW